MTRTIIAGSRSTSAWMVYAAIQSCPWLSEITVVLSGCNKIVHEDGTITGADYYGEQWAILHNIPIEPYPYLRQYGRAGGPIRNSQMAAVADALILVWDEKSTGSADMLKKARARGLLLHVKTFNELVQELV